MDSTGSQPATCVPDSLWNLEPLHSAPPSSGAKSITGKQSPSGFVRKTNGIPDDLPWGESRRNWLFIKQGGICHYCRQATSWEDWTVEHRIPRSRGGKGDPNNLVGACWLCNNRKGNRTEEEFVFGVGGVYSGKAKNISKYTFLARYSLLRARLHNQNILRRTGQAEANRLCNARKSKTHYKYSKSRKPWWQQGPTSIPNPVIAAECQSLV